MTALPDLSGFFLVRIDRPGRSAELTYVRADKRCGAVVFQNADGDAKAMLFNDALWGHFTSGSTVLLVGGGSIKLER
jgi:hypothetical protein